MVIDCLTCCTDLVVQPEARYAVGWLIIAITLQNIIVGLVILIYSPFRKLKLWLKWCRNVRDRTGGRTLAYSRRAMKQSLLKKLSSVERFVSSRTVSNFDNAKKRVSKTMSKMVIS